MKNKKWYVVGILGVLFVILSILVVFNKLEQFDTFIYELFTINDLNTTIFKIITFFGSTLFIVLLVIFFFVLFLILKKKNYSFIIASTLIISTIINNVIKIIIRRDRPTVLALVTESTYSFPSGHMMAAVSMYGILFYLVLKSNMDKKLKGVLGTFLIILPLLVGMSRIYLGAHFASDIIGATLMSLILLIVIANYIEKKKLLVVK